MTTAFRNLDGLIDRSKQAPKRIKFRLEGRPSVAELQKLLQGAQACHVAIEMNSDFALELQTEVCALLNKNEQAQEIGIRYYSKESSGGNLDVSTICRLKRLSGLDIWTEKDATLTGLGSNNNLRALSLSAAGNCRLSVPAIGRLAELVSLTIGGSILDLIENLDGIKSIQDLTINRFPGESFTWCQDFAHLDRLIITEYKASARLDLKNSHLNSLRILQSKKLVDVSSIGSLKNLEELELINLYAVQELPSFSKLSRLHKLRIDNLTHLHDLRPILEAKNLRVLWIQDAAHLTAAEFLPLKDHASLKEGRFGLGSKKRNDEIHQLLGI